MRALQELIVIGPEASVRVARRRAKHYHFEWHFHDEVELTLIVKGTGRRYVGDSVEEYRDGDFVLIAPGIPHAWESSMDSRDVQDALVAQFRFDVLDGWPELYGVRQLVEAASRGVRFVGPGTEQAVQRFENLSQSRGLPQVLLLLELVHYLSVEQSVIRTPIASPCYESSGVISDERVRRVLNYVADHFAEPLTQSEMGELVEMSPPSFARLFRNATGNTFTHYVRQVRVAAACRQLVETGDTITDIAFSNGFSNLAHFNRTFLMLKKLTPSAFRAAYTRDDVVT